MEQAPERRPSGIVARLMQQYVARFNKAHVHTFLSVFPLGKDWEVEKA
jgi:hypothetical protein